MNGDWLGGKIGMEKQMQKGKFRAPANSGIVIEVIYSGYLHISDKYTRERAIGLPAWMRETSWIIMLQKQGFRDIWLF